MGPAGCGAQAEESVQRSSLGRADLHLFFTLVGPAILPFAHCRVGIDGVCIMTTCLFLDPFP